MVEGLAPLGVYVHWPYCARICPYCDFNVVRDRGATAQQAALVDAICADLVAHRHAFGDRRLVSIFFGGGTPSLLAPDAVARIIALCRSLWTPAATVEISLEANPTDAEASRFSALADAGVNRLSLGVQSLDDEALTFLGRNHGAAEARRAAQLARKHFPQVSLDLIYALPGQTPAAWSAALADAAALDPDHLSPYQLTIEPGTAFDRAVRRRRFSPVDDEQGADLYAATQAVLTGLGYHAYEVSNHARGAGARSRHNLVYWRGEEYAGVGPGAHGRWRTPASWMATVAPTGIEAYLRLDRASGVHFAETETLTPRQRAEERLLMGLRIEDGVPWPDLAPLDLHPASPDVVRLADMGLLTLADDRLAVTGQGRSLLDSVVRALTDPA